MRARLTPDAKRLLQRLPRTSPYTLAELVLLALLAIQCARLFWTMLTPVGPVGEWRAADAFRPLPKASAETLGGFDPFFRLAASSGAQVVTSLDLKLFGVREDRATGRGAAIIGTPDGQQKSYAVGEEIMPGAVLTAVRFDGVTITRNGTAEQVYLDQSTPAPVASPGGVTPGTAPTPPVQNPTSNANPAPTAAPPVTPPPPHAKAVPNQ